MSLTQKYAAALLSFSMVILSALTVLLVPGGLTPTGAVAFVGVLAGGIIMFIVPLEKTGWQGRTKTIIAFIVPAAAAVIPFLWTHDFTLIQWVTLGIALTKAAAVALGVTLRTDYTVTPQAIPVQLVADPGH